MSWGFQWDGSLLEPLWSVLCPRLWLCDFLPRPSNHFPELCLSFRRTASKSRTQRGKDSESYQRSSPLSSSQTR